MPAEKFVHDFVKEAGYTPIPDRAIVVTYAPADLSEKMARFFSNEFFALQMCENSLVLLPFGRMSMVLKKDVVLEIPYDRIRKVKCGRICSITVSNWIPMMVLSRFLPSKRASMLCVTPVHCLWA